MLGLTWQLAMIDDSLDDFSTGLWPPVAAPALEVDTRALVEHVRIAEKSLRTLLSSEELDRLVSVLEEKVFEDLHAKNKDIPAELKLTFRYVCPDSPYLSADAASGANDALPNAALQFFGSGNKRFYIDPNKRLETSNKGATQQAQKVLARATASLGCDPRTPGAFAMEQAVQKPTPQQQQLMVNEGTV